MDLATILANGVAAEAMVRTVAAQLDVDWSEYLTTYGDPASTDEARAVAYGKLLAIAGYRALVTSAVDIWDREPAPGADVVQIAP